MNRLRAARHPVIRYTPFTFWIGPMLVMAEILSGLASMPRSETMKPSSMPLGTPKTHFSGLSLIPFAQSFAKICLRSATRWSARLDFTMMSST